MKAIKIKLSQNIGNLSSLPGDQWDGHFAHFDKQNSTAQVLSAADQILWLTERVIELLSQTSSVLAELTLIRKTMSQALPNEKRVEIFRRMNIILGAFFAGKERNPEIFRMCFEIMTILKEQTDTSPQQDMMLAEEEWAEFEKSIYLLSDWEDLLGAGIPLHHPNFYG